MTQQDYAIEKFIRNFNVACGCGLVLYMKHLINTHVVLTDNMLSINMKCSNCGRTHTLTSVNSESNE